MLPSSCWSFARGPRPSSDRRTTSLLACLVLAGAAGCAELPTQSSGEAARGASPLRSVAALTEVALPNAQFTRELAIPGDESTGTNCRMALPFVACDYHVWRISGLPSGTQLHVRMTYVADVAYKCIQARSGRTMSTGRLDGVMTQFESSRQIFAQPTAVFSGFGGQPALPAHLCRKQEAPGDLLVFPRAVYLQVGYSPSGSFVQLDRWNYLIPRELPVD
jgi:hypothetical protein